MACWWRGKKGRGDAHWHWFFVVILNTHKQDTGPSQSHGHTPCPSPSSPSAAPGMRFMPISVSNGIWHDADGMFQSGLSVSTFPPLRSSRGPGPGRGAAEAADPGVWAERAEGGRKLWWNLRRRKSKVNSRFTGIRFTSLNCFPPSSALRPSGKCFSKSTCWNFKRPMNFQCFKGRHKPKPGCNCSLPAGTANATKPPVTEDTRCLQGRRSARSKDLK